MTLTSQWPRTARKRLRKGRRRRPWSNNQTGQFPARNVSTMGDIYTLKCSPWAEITGACERAPNSSERKKISSCFVFFPFLFSVKDWVTISRRSEQSGTAQPRSALTLLPHLMLLPRLPLINPAFTANSWPRLVFISFINNSPHVQLSAVPMWKCVSPAVCPSKSLQNYSLGQEQVALEAKGIFSWHGDAP